MCKLGKVQGSEKLEQSSVSIHSTTGLHIYHHLIPEKEIYL